LLLQGTLAANRTVRASIKMGHFFEIPIYCNYLPSVLEGNLYKLVARTFKPFESLRHVDW